MSLRARICVQYSQRWATLPHMRGPNAQRGAAMDPERLSRITTLWTLVRHAHEDAGSEVREAQKVLLDRYGGAIRRYLRGAVRDNEAADELFQEFAYRFLHGDLRKADSGRGRFRDYVRGVLYHLIADYHKQRQRQPRALEFEPSAQES